ncbi:MAG: type II secretion system F family protein, partial [Promethearchaeia archaeon]
MSPLISLSVPSVYAAAYLVSITVLVGIAAFLLALQSTVFLLVPVALLGGALFYYVIVTHPERVMDRYKIMLSEHADMIFEQFVLVYASGGTIFDAIEMVAQSDYPYLSTAFRDMLLQIQDGAPPEKCLTEFAKNQPSKDLRRYITAILSSSERETGLLNSLSGKSFEADMALRQKNLELESRLLIVSALSTYLPIVITLAISLSGFAQNWVVLLIAPLLMGIHYSLKSRFAEDFSVYFDVPNPDSKERYSQQEAIDEHDEFLNMLMLLGERLAFGDTCEVAIREIRDRVNPPTDSLLEVILASIYIREESLSDAFHEASDHAIGLRVARLLRIIPLMCERSAREAGGRIIQIASRLVERSATAKERDSII